MRRSTMTDLAFAVAFALTIATLLGWNPLLAGPASADSHERDTPRAFSDPLAIPTPLDVVTQMRKTEHRLHKKRAKARHSRFLAHQRAAARKRARMRRAAKAAKRTPHAVATLSASVPSASLQAIARCESGGNPTAVSAGGTYRGKYQFDYGTWRSVGGSGDPAAAPESEQDMRAALLHAKSGSRPWPVCG